MAMVSGNAKGGWEDGVGMEEWTKGSTRDAPETQHFVFTMR
jgi:hypothetical protein